MADQSGMKWLLLIHQIPPKPDYFRVKIWRRLRKAGAVAIKQSVYVLPESETAREDLSWIVREIDEGGGTASLCRTVFIEGLSDKQIIMLFQVARDEDYQVVAQEARLLFDALKITEAFSADTLKNRSKLSRLWNRFEEIGEIDFFCASGRQVAADVLDACKAMLKSVHGRPGTKPAALGARGRTWVTRAGIYVDRIASAWLIRKFVDPDARFKFVASDRYRPQPDEYRFDMFEAEFSHEGDKCTFEVLMHRFSLASPSMGAVGEIIHDIDLKDKKFDRPETSGIQALFSGLATAQVDDDARIERGAWILDELYAYFEARYR